jgi:hypothetical protein
MDFPLTLLRGHVSQETAYVVDDYPYGRTLRCKIRYWLETATKGKGKGETRFVSQTSDPKRDNLVWNKPKAGNYCQVLFMYQDTRNGYIHTAGMTFPGPDSWATFYAYGLYQQMNAEEKKYVDTLIAVSRKMNPSSYKEWDEHTEKVKLAVAQHGLDNPDLYKLGGFDERNENYIYELTFQKIVNMLKADQGIFTIPTEK